MNTVNHDVANWIKRLERKAPYYLYSESHIKYYHNGIKDCAGKSYTVIWKDGVKTKIGVLKDGMYCRYGIATFGVLKGTSPLGLWQSGGGGTINEDQLSALIKVARGEPLIQEFDFSWLKDLTH